MSWSHSAHACVVVVLYVDYAEQCAHLPLAAVNTVTTAVAVRGAVHMWAGCRLAFDLLQTTTVCAVGWMLDEVD